MYVVCLKLMAKVNYTTVYKYTKLLNMSRNVQPGVKFWVKMQTTIETIDAQVWVPMKITIEMHNIFLEMSLY